MEPLLALAAVRSMASIVANLTAPAAPRAPVNTRAPRPAGPFAKAAGAEPRFENFLRSELDKSRPAAGPLAFSPEATQRMQAMGVRLSQAQYDRLMEGVREAAAKGGHRSLIMMDGLAFTVDVREGKVIDVANRNRIDTRVYTQIDSIVETKI
ncbi:hypothetical protein ACFLQ0_00900 [Nitrospinota bacterium]